MRFCSTRFAAGQNPWTPAIFECCAPKIEGAAVEIERNRVVSLARGIDEPDRSLLRHCSSNIEAQGEPSLGASKILHRDLLHHRTLLTGKEQPRGELQLAEGLGAYHAVWEPLVFDSALRRRCNCCKPAVKEQLTPQDVARAPSHLRRSAAGVRWERNGGDRGYRLPDLCVSELIHCCGRVKEFAKVIAQAVGCQVGERRGASQLPFRNPRLFGQVPQRCTQQSRP